MGGMGVHRVLDYVRASLFIKDIKRINAAKDAFKQLLVKPACANTELHDDKLHAKSRRRARLNLDATSMLLIR